MFASERSLIWLRLGFSIALLLTSVFQFYRELRYFSESRHDISSLASQQTADRTTFFLSLHSQRYRLERCHRAAGDVAALDYSAIRLLSVSTYCFDLAKNHLSNFPTDSFGWLVRAEASIDGHPERDFSRYLSTSRRTGPSEAWLAIERIRLCSSNWTYLSSPDRTSCYADVALLARSPLGKQHLATEYARSTLFRTQFGTALKDLVAGSLIEGAIAR